MLVKRSPLIHLFIIIIIIVIIIIISKQKKTKEQKIKQKIKHISDTLRQVQAPLSIFAFSSKN